MGNQYQFTVPDQKKIRYIIHSDAKNEADDQFTIVHALLTQKLDVRGIIAGHFDTNPNPLYAGHTAQASFDEIQKLLKLMHLEKEYPVYLGANHGLDNASVPIVTDAARFIVEEAMKEDPRPLYIGMQGAITDLACAILMEPRICSRMTCIWIGGGYYPEGGEEFNLMGDVLGANLVFQSEMPLWQVPRNAYKQFTTSLAELQVKVAPYGKIGRYLFEQMAEFNLACADRPMWPHGEIWSLGDEGCIAALLHERGRTDLFDEIPAPMFDLSTMKYLPQKGARSIRVYHHMDARFDLEDLFAKLQINFPEQDS